MSAAPPKSDTFFLDEFAQKQFNDIKPDYSGTRIYFDTSEFVAKVKHPASDPASLCLLLLLNLTCLSSRSSSITMVAQYSLKDMHRSASTFLFPTLLVLS